MSDNVSLTTVLFLSGLDEEMNHRAALFFITLLCYCVILLGNVTVIMTIILDKNLHEPMYILLCLLCLNALIGTTGFYPKLLWDLLSPVHVISYSGCIVQALVVYFFTCADMSILAVMAYDRYVAICRPLQYHSVMTKQKVIRLACLCCITPVALVAVNISLTSRLRLCSWRIARLYCVNWIIVKLACFPADTIVNNIVSYLTFFVFTCCGCYIYWSYMRLIITCVKSKEKRQKFMQTCVPHLISLITYGLTVSSDGMNMRVGSNNIPQHLQNFIAMEYLLIPPVLNPFVHGLKLTKIRKRIVQVITCKIK